MGGFLAYGANRPPKPPFELNKDSPQARGLIGWWSSQIVVGNQTLPKDLSIEGDRADFEDNNGTPDRIMTELGVPGIYLDPASSERITSVAEVSLAIPLTLVIWVKPITMGSDKYIFNVAFDDQNAVIVNGTSTNTFRAIRKDGGLTDISGTLTASLGEWHMMAGMFDANLCRIWVDGVAGTDNTDANSPSGLNDVFIGSKHNNSNNPEMTFIDARVYNRVLTNTELLHMYQPATRWDLYREVGWRLSFVPPIAGGNPKGPLGMPLHGPFGGPI